MKRFAGFLLALSAAFGLCLQPVRAAGTTFGDIGAGSSDIIVLYTNDVHGGISDNAGLTGTSSSLGYAGIAAVRAEAQAQAAGVLLVDNGDSIQGAVFDTLSDGTASMDLMEKLGYDLCIPGNHEFDFGVDTFLDEVKNHSIEGTGLGMSIVTNLLKLMDSEIYVDSKYGIGSTFYFVIRQQVSDKTPIGDYTQRTAKSRKLDGLELFHAPDAKILVVDDNDMNLKVAGNLLGLFGIRPKMVGSGSEAIDCVKTENYHMILLDHMMPKMDGIETLRKMRSDKLLPKDAKVIALTANAVNGARDRYLSAGFDDYLSKPIEVSGLEELLKKYLPRDVLEKTEDAAKEDGIMEFDPVPEDYEVSDLDTSLDAEKIMIDKLKGLDLDTEAALSFCAGEFALYEEILGDYVKACKDRKEELDACCKNADWHEFEVKVHALKSTSKTIGAIELYERALSLEEAAEKKDEDYIRENYPAFAQDYQELAETISKVVRL